MTPETEYRRLVYYEAFDTVLEALAREKAIRACSRDWKIRLIHDMNPGWRDLAADHAPNPPQNSPPGPPLGENLLPPVDRSDFRAARRGLSRRVRDRQHLYLDLTVRRLQ